MRASKMVPPRLRFLVLTAIGMAVATVVVMGWKHLPIRDPDYAAVGPSWLVIPSLVAVAVLLDVLVHALGPWLRARFGADSVAQRSGFRHFARAAWQRRWTGDQWRFLVVGLVGWYVCYTAFRNLKHAVPFVTDRLWDLELTDFDKALFLGHTPWDLLHQALGVGVAAYVLSAIYVIWIGFVPVSMWWALVWTRDHVVASWYVTALGLGWSLGALGYFLMPSLGPIYSSPASFAALPDTTSAWLARSLAEDRLAVVPPSGDPHSAHVLQTIAAFPSLHVGIMVIASLIVFSKTRKHWLRMTITACLVLTIVATIYLGWHFSADVLGGFVLGFVAVWVSGRLTGNRMHWMPEVEHIDEIISDETPRSVARAE